jgi:phospholipase C
MQLSSLNVAGPTSMPAPQASGIDHIVVVTMENRSFDHLLGWLPNADGRQSGLSYSDTTGNVHSTHWLAAPPTPDYTGCGHPDPDHSYTGARTCYNDRNMDGFLKDSSNDDYCLGYYTAADIPFYAALAQSYTVCDKWYASILGPTFPNRMFTWAAQTDRLGNTVNLSSLTTIFDRLSRAGVSHRYYFNNLPYLALWGLKYVFSTSPFSTFLSDAASGKLPSVSFVDPTYTVLDDGTGNDDHPHADIRNGDAFLAKVFFALGNGPKWASTVLIVNFDEWGGFFEHVAPPRVIAPNNIDTDLVNGQALLGFRVPTVIASPFTRSANNQPNRVDHSVYDHTAALKLIEWRWGLKPLTARDASLDIGNPAAAFNFESPDSSVPALPQPLPVFAPPCLEGGILNASTEPLATAKTQTANEFAALANSASTREFLQHPHLTRQFQ